MLEVAQVNFIGRKEELNTLEKEFRRDGSFVVIYGRRRIGKTTLIKCLLQLIPYDGKVYFQDRLINDLDKRSLAEIFSYVPQIKTLVDHISVIEFVVAGRTRFLPSYQTPSDKDYDIALNALKELDLSVITDVVNLL